VNSFRFSREANHDLEEISLYIFELNPPAAQRFLNSIEESCELLAEHPQLGKLRQEFGERLRSFPVGNYPIFYKPVFEGVDIVRIIYGGRDLPRVFRG
jgi:toxin ParE1/3/4